MKFYEVILNFYKRINFDESILPNNVGVMNPFFNESNGEIKETIYKFYKKFYNDNKTRRIILGINPGRHGAGVTGIPFTDTKRLNSECKIEFTSFSTHETSSVFVYDMINAFGGVNKFYKQFYISSISPLGFVKFDDKGKETNFNYYDDSKFMEDIKNFAIETINQQLEFGIDRKYAYCWGTGKNYKYLSKLNEEQNFFENIIPLAHPRYIMQYRLKKKDEFINEYLEAFNIK